MERILEQIPTMVTNTLNFCLWSVVGANSTDSGCDDRCHVDGSGAIVTSSGTLAVAATMALGVVAFINRKRCATAAAKHCVSCACPFFGEQSKGDPDPASRLLSK